MKLYKSLTVLLLASLTTFSASALPEIERVSLGPFVNTINTSGESREPSVSSDGRYVVFESIAFDITADDNNNVQDIFRHDRQTNTSVIVSRASGVSGTLSNARSLFADMSDDGRYIVFSSRGQNLTTDTAAPKIPDPDNDLATCIPTTDPTCEDPQQIYLRDMTNNTTILVSVQGGNTSCAGACTAGNSQSTKSSISADGLFIVYESLANDILAADTDATKTRFDSDIYRYEIASGTTVLVSTADISGKGDSRSLDAAISDTGRFVVFSSDATNLGGSLTDGVRDVFLRDMAAGVSGVTVAITNGTTGEGGFTDSHWASVTADGNLVAYESYRKDLVSGDTNDVRDIFVYNRSTGQTSRISVSSAGAQSNGISKEPEISSDGRYVVFESIATNLVEGDNNAMYDVFVRDLTLNKTKRVSLRSDGDEDNGENTTAKLSSNGRFIVFTSQSPLVTDDNHSPRVRDIYIYERTGRSDFDNDGHSDVFWRNSVTAANKIYLMNGTTIRSDTAFNEVQSTDWEAFGIGDFDNDGKDDVVWRNKSTGVALITFMDGATASNSSVISGLTTDTTWQIVGVGNFDDDSFDDLLIRNNNTGENRIVFMSGATVTSNLSVDTNADLNWKVAGVGDFNNDKKADILWRHDVNRRVWLYLMNGNTITNGGGAGVHVVFTSANWDISGVGDFNDDGKSDILWRHNTNGRVWMYLMNSEALINTTNGEPGQHVAFSSLEWSIDAVGDYNGDGKDDIFWRNNTFGFNHQYLMNGASITTNEGVNTLSDLNWGIVPSDD